MKKKHELIDLSLYAIIASYLFGFYEIFLQKFFPLGGLEDFLSPLFYILFIFGFFAGIKVIFDKNYVRNRRYWTVVGLEIVGVILMVFIIFNPSGF